MKLPIYKYINLTTQEVQDYPITKELYEKYVGGKILAAKLLTDLTPAGLDPLEEKSFLIINTGVMTGTGAPSSGRFNMTFKNVLTGGIATANCGGSFGMMLKRSGCDGIILTGKCEKLSSIVILDNEVQITPCPELAEMDTQKVQQQFPVCYGKLAIGPAGEKLVKYACAVSQERVAGRCGSGAVLGSKNIKIIAAYGTQKTEIAFAEKYKNYIKKWTKFIRSHPMTGKALPLYGTAGLVNKANVSHALPTYNFQQGTFDKATQICGETLTEKYVVKNYGCLSCPIRCGRRVYVGEEEVKGPEYETVGLLGSNIGNSDLAVINRLNLEADLYGLDTISLGGTLAFAMELKQKGMADFGVAFGKTDNLSEVIRKIAYREDIYFDLGEGSKKLSEKYGGEDFAIHAKGLELAAYDPRASVGMGLGYATSNRGGCHLNGGYLALMESVGVMGMNPTTTKGKAELTILFQNAMEACSAAGFCLFTLQTFTPAVLFKTGPYSFWNKLAGGFMLQAKSAIKIIQSTLPWGLPFYSMYLFPQCKAIYLATGISMTTGQFLQLGERGFNIERLYNIREGLDYTADRLPKRLTTEVSLSNPKGVVVDMDAMLPQYYRVRGWNEEGIPTEKKRKKLGIQS